jgi:glycosyltransferase involved in cell wall biosynthesis
MIAAGLSSAPGIVLAQYVPSAFGARGLNVPFCRWLARLRRDGIDVRIMFHEPFFYFGAARPWRNVFAVVQRVMAAILLRGATRVYYSTEAWARVLAPYGPQAGAGVLPVPSTIPSDVPDEAIAAARTRRRGAFVIGHFGTYGDHIGRQLVGVLPALLRRLPDARVLLAGSGSDAFARTLPADVRDRVDAAGRLPGIEAAAVLRACDLLVQPYPDGVTTRRTSIMAALTTSVPVLTTSGALTEPVWADSSAVALVPAGDVTALVDRAAALAADAAGRAALGARGRDLYDRQFALAVTIARLRR